MVKEKLLKDWFKHVWDNYYEKDKWKIISIWNKFISFWWYMLKEVKDLIKKYDIQYIIDEDNNMWIIQDIRSRWDMYLEYTIRTTDKTYIDNHNSNTNMWAVYRMLNNIKKWRRTIEEYLDFYLK